jgi:hypothetical protein
MCASSTATTASPLENNTGKPILVPGYDGEPYLRFTADAVYRNERSPATYLNEDRYGGVELPAGGLRRHCRRALGRYRWAARSPLCRARPTTRLVWV